MEIFYDRFGPNRILRDLIGQFQQTFYHVFHRPIDTRNFMDEVSDAVPSQGGFLLSTGIPRFRRIFPDADGFDRPAIVFGNRIMCAGIGHLGSLFSLAVYTVLPGKVVPFLV